MDTTNSFSAGGLPADVFRNPNLSRSDLTLGRWFDTGTPQQPAPYAFGKQGINIRRADGLMNVDSSVLRNFHIDENVLTVLVAMLRRGEPYDAARRSTAAAA